ncbi:Protein kinase domain [Macleaya cordata]|uniref:Protein kinase domain n=1 Tax=Macleaya cordata TaxID=56857 RepID=A0A200Q4I4_MACCD|nr:Protein kinase domain [Macleaya cordata]
MIDEFKFMLILLGFLLLFSVPCSHGESSKCLMVYKEGGAPAVFQSPKCPRWSLSNEAYRWRTDNCQSAMLQGRRKHQEDRTFCALDMRIPFPGRTGIKEVMVGMVAVFDGHSGAEASEMASQLLLEYFFLHVYFLLDGIYSAVLEKSTGKLLYKGELDLVFQVLNRDKRKHYDLDLRRSKWMFSEIFDASFHMEILKESLLRAIHDIDATFSKAAFRNNLDSGSTATIVLIVDGQILVANVGDSKALLCSERFQSAKEVKDTLLRLYRQRRRNGSISPIKKYDNFKGMSSDGLKHFIVKELTTDHHPDRDDERSRVEAAGGYVVEWNGVYRVNGELAVSRAIGDVSFKSYGVISAPEVTGWQPLTANDSYLVAASDGVFEKMSTQDICDLLWHVNTQGSEKPEHFSSRMYSLADCIVNTAFEEGSMDNLAAVVVPLRSTSFYRTPLKEGSDGEGSIYSSGLGRQKLSSINSANVINSGLVPLEYAHRVMTTFNRLLVEGTHDKFGCFYLSENLNENMDDVFGVQKDGLVDEVYDQSRALSEPFAQFHSGPLNLYTDQNLCLNFGMDIEEKGQCINPEGFTRFLGLLESIPFVNVDLNSSESFGYETPNSRYVLKRRFGRGSYGDVWLAFHWNCSQGGDALNWIHTKENCSTNNIGFEPNEYNMCSETNSSSHHCDIGPDYNNMFILKRIMVEKGNNVYLSGLRERYFGEIFLNASVSLRGQTATGLSNSSREAQYDSCDLLDMNESILREIEYIKNLENICLGNFRMHRADDEEGLKHIARYIESFESQSKEIWLVFRNEGISLSKLMYTAEEGGKHTDQEGGERVKNIQLLHPSTWWHWLRSTEAGKEEMRNLMWQLLMALKSCHDRNITHRDIKPENMVICFEDEETGRCLKGSPIGDKHHHMKMRIIDFGSAIDEFTIKHLYGSNGPSRFEQTHEYTAPEALLNVRWFQKPPNVTLKYDMWSVGVVMLELILGSPHVFQINARTRALLDPHLEGWNEDMKELAYKLRSFMEMCILIPGSSPKRHRTGDAKDQSDSPASWKCSEEYFLNQVKNRDPLKLGFPNVWAMRLVRQLLLWDPEDRLSVDDALRHPYFQPPR